MNYTSLHSSEAVWVKKSSPVSARLLPPGESEGFKTTGVMDVGGFIGIRGYNRGYHIKNYVFISV